MTKDTFKTVVAYDNSNYGLHYYDPYNGKDKALKAVLKRVARRRVKNLMMKELDA